MIELVFIWMIGVNQPSTIERTYYSMEECQRVKSMVAAELAGSRVRVLTLECRRAK